MLCCSSWRESASGSGCDGGGFCLLCVLWRLNPADDHNDDDDDDDDRTVYVYLLTEHKNL